MLGIIINAEIIHGKLYSAWGLSCVGDSGASDTSAFYTNARTISLGLTEISPWIFCGYVWSCYEFSYLIDFSAVLLKKIICHSFQLLCGISLGSLSYFICKSYGIFAGSAASMIFILLLFRVKNVIFDISSLLSR